MRREMFYFAKLNINFKCIVPIRDFRSFYFSKIKGRYNTNKINNFYLNEAWEHWKHKTIDYLLLKKRYPKKFILVRYEDLVNKKEVFHKLLNKIDIKKKYIPKPTFHGKLVLGNSSFQRKNKKKIYTNSTKRLLPKKYLNEEYHKISQLIKKYTI